MVSGGQVRSRSRIPRIQQLIVADRQKGQEVVAADRLADAADIPPQLPIAVPDRGGTRIGLRKAVRTPQVNAVTAARE
ncbi:hypothetical protein A6A40_13390 [Azospirillum humicireducens]|uniref:Uncharacterized protein n=1 Tax=Azospirillum humicireducens TaxID=1226968 RepID=A0A160JI80_9PROT|nr:hypothetical protein A6A40_13390 [Azospirillum humicireducens]